MSNTNYTEAQRVDRCRFLQHFDDLMKGSDFKPMAASLITEVCEKYGLSYPTPSPKDQPTQKLLPLIHATDDLPDENKLVAFQSKGMWFTGWYHKESHIFEDVKGGTFPVEDVWWVGERAVVQPEGQKTLRWVKASERLPVNPYPDHRFKAFQIIFKSENNAGTVWADTVKYEVVCKNLIERGYEWLEEYTPETSSPVVQSDFLSEMRDKAIQDGFDDLCLSHGPYKDECLQCAREETRQMASEAGMSQEAYDRQTSPVSEDKTLPFNEWLDKYCDPHKFADPARTRQGEIPEEIKIEKFIIHCLNKFSWTDSAYKNAHRSMIDLYHKMQEEIEALKLEIIEWRRLYNSVSRNY